MRYRERCISIFGSLSKCLYYPGLGQAEARNEELHPGLHVVLAYLEPSAAASPSELAGNRSRRRAVETWTGTPWLYTCQHHSWWLHLQSYSASPELSRFMCGGRVAFKLCHYTAGGRLWLWTLEFSPIQYLLPADACGQFVHTTEWQGHGSVPQY